ncbi:MAG: DUF2911 domain-containing protein [Cyclobacteriaceae bacterium]
MRTVRNTFYLALSFIMASHFVNAQEKRASPPANVKATINGTDIIINYSSPSVKGRTIWGDLVPYDKVWRTGANEATTIEFSKDVKVEGKSVKAGKYALFTVPGKDKWKVILNAVPDQWGAYNYDASKDIFSFETKPKSDKMSESLKFGVSDKGTVTMNWEKLKVSFDVKQG